LHLGRDVGAASACDGSKDQLDVQTGLSVRWQGVNVIDFAIRHYLDSPAPVSTIGGEHTTFYDAATGAHQPTTSSIVESMDRHMHLIQLQGATQVATLLQLGLVRFLLEPVPKSTKSIRAQRTLQLVHSQVWARLLTAQLQHLSFTTTSQTIILIVTQPLPGLELMNIQGTKRGNLRKNKRTMTRHFRGEEAREGNKKEKQIEKKSSPRNKRPTIVMPTVKKK
jgi:hypothetical protein